jgi:hypothetical protein
MYSRFNNVDYSCRLFNSVGEKNITVWNCILSAFVQCRLADNTFDFYRQMFFLNVKHDAVKTPVLDASRSSPRTARRLDGRARTCAIARMLEQRSPKSSSPDQLTKLDGWVQYSNLARA